MAKQNFLPLLVIAAAQNVAEKLNGLLRGAGHPVRPVWAGSADDITNQLKTARPDVIFYFIGTANITLPALMALRNKHAPAVPVLCVTQDATEEEVAKVLQTGARDLVSLDHVPRLEAVMLRELKVMRQRRELLTLRKLAEQYQERFKSLMQDSDDAIAYVQDGLHMEANPGWLEKFGYSAEDIEGIPVMDLFYGEDQATLKAALRDLAKGKDVAPLEIRGLAAGSEPFETRLEFSRAKLRDEPCIEIAIRGEAEVDTSAMEAQIAEMAKRDPLTGLYHRHHFVDLLDDEMRTKKTKVAQAVLFIKPDSFSEIDDKVGPTASDAVLKLFGETLNAKLDKQDTGARFGGNIFTVLLTRPALKDIEAWAEKLRAEINGKIFDAGGQSLSMTCSIGIADFGMDANNAGALISLAQKANKQAREAGGDQAQLYKPPQEEGGKLSDVGWIRQITNALKQGKFRLAYQPIASLEGSDAGMFDVLVRMLGDDGREIMPGEFIPPAERNGLMVGIDRWIMEHAFKVLAERLKESKQTKFFLRLADQSLVDGSLPGWIDGQIKSNKLPPANVVFQIAERAAESHLKETKQLADALAKIQCGVALEHFGIGHAPLQMLDHIKAQFIKIDGSFMANIGDETTRSKVQGLIEKAKKLQIATVAERVENANAMATLWSLGVGYIQGNYVQEPEVIMAEEARVPGV